MFDRAKVLILIQARSASTRLPRKVHLPVNGKPILQRVLDTCNVAADFLNRQPNLNCVTQTAIACPIGDEIVGKYNAKAKVYEGSEHDVLDRFRSAVSEDGADLVVRVTADCVLIPAFIISRMIKAALYKRNDYTSNVIYRSFMEGYDCEVFKADFLDFLDAGSTEEERQHVTLAAKRLNLAGDRRFSALHVFDRIDLSRIKTSVDTKEDYDRVCQLVERLEGKKAAAAINGTVSE